MTNVPSTSAGSRRVAAVLVVLVVAAGGWFGWHFLWRASVRAEHALARARSFRAAQDILQAERAAAEALELDPALGEAALLAAQCAEAQREYSRAVEYVRRVTTGDPRIRLRAALLAAGLNHHRLHRLGEAEQSYRTALEISPEHVEANAGLAQLLGLCGRRSEAVPLILQVVRGGETSDLLILLARADGVIGDLDALNEARKAAPGDPNPLVGLAWHAADSGEIDRAIHLLKEAIRLDSGHAAAHVALGRQLFEARRFEELVRWASRAPPAVDTFADFWLVRARMAEHDGDAKGAIRCYGEAVRRAPESKATSFRLVRLLADAGLADGSARFAEHVLAIQALETAQTRVLFSGSPPTADALLELVDLFERAGRRWEALGWCRFATQFDPQHGEAQRRLSALVQEVEGLPLRQTVDAANPALALDLSAYPLPHWRESPAWPVPADSRVPSPVSFRDDATTSGLSFRYFNGTAGTPSRRMFEFTGGGIGALDYDGDGFPDLWFTQGRLWPPATPDTQHGDRLFRNHSGERFEDVSAAAGIREQGFGQGVAAGDFNADGFPDLYVANIGPNCLWVNNGDGTFTDATRDSGLAGNEWTTSCVMADLDGDGLLDLYDVNYVTAGDVFDRVCAHPDGAPKMCMPFDFEAQPDRLWLNDGAGRFTDATVETLSPVPAGKGLGAAVWDAYGTGRLCLFVANDTTPSFFYVPESNGKSRPRLREHGFESGLALNSEGKATGSMGIALGDVDGDGRTDLHITNFFSESNTLFTSTVPGTYEDRARELGLLAPTVDLLGFGTQFLDADLDGRCELFVANGHVDDWRDHGRPYRMPPQLFRWSGRRFDLVSNDAIGPYFRESWLGRAVARLDWNRDGQDDLAVGHLADEAALLTNTTPTAGRFLAVRLVGVLSCRDAIGTTLTITAGKRGWTHQLTAGDGYHASNDRRLVFGVGQVDRIDELTVRWPSGTQQVFHDLPASSDLLLIEGRPALRAN